MDTAELEYQIDVITDSINTLPMSVDHIVELYEKRETLIRTLDTLNNRYKNLYPYNQ